MLQEEGVWVGVGDTSPFTLNHTHTQPVFFDSVLERKWDNIIRFPLKTYLH
jgi:hypothetical protein